MKIQSAINLIRQNAEHYSYKQPTLGTLLEEIAELARSLEGKHEHTPELELVQIGGIVVNMLTQYHKVNAVIAIEKRKTE